LPISNILLDSEQLENELAELIGSLPGVDPIKLLPIAKRMVHLMNGEKGPSPLRRKVRLNKSAGRKRAQLLLQGMSTPLTMTSSSGTTGL
jgi:hypothetical protein